MFQPLNVSREKKIKREEVSVDVSLSLEQRLCGSAQPAPGLEYVREYWNPREMTAHPMYTCTLEGCKSAWGTSDDMFHHVTKDKHQKNFFKKLYPGDQRVAQLSKDKVLTEVGGLLSLCPSWHLNTNKARVCFRQLNGRRIFTQMEIGTTVA